MLHEKYKITSRKPPPIKSLVACMFLLYGCNRRYGRLFIFISTSSHLTSLYFTIILSNN